MSIHLEGPSLLLNSYDFADAFGGCGMLMDKTWNCPKNTTAKHVANWIGVAAKDAGGSLANVVLNFHGEPGRVLVGEATPGKMMRSGTYINETFHVIDNDNAGVLFPLRQFKIGTLWFHSCDLAGGTIGKKFCRQLAITAGCAVVAAEKEQEEWWNFVNAIFMPKGSIDDFEGPVYIWDKKGEMQKFDPNGGSWK